jgi:hypothetical protein
MKGLEKENEQKVRKDLGYESLDVVQEAGQDKNAG